AARAPRAPEPAASPRGAGVDGRACVGGVGHGGVMAYEPEREPKVMSEREQKVVTLTRQGMSARAIARALHIGRNRVRRILREHGRARTEPHSALPEKSRRLERPSKLDPFTEKIERLLERYPDITAQRVFEELRAAGYDG